jgi:hypothetical protein
MSKILGLGARGVLAILAGAVLVGIGSAVAISGGQPSRSAQASYARYRSAFAVLTHKVDRAAAVSQSFLPSDAILATTAGDRHLYVWERAAGAPMGKSGTPSAKTQLICQGYLVGQAASSPGGVSCGEISELAQTGSVTFGKVRNPGTHTFSNAIVTVLVPNGVKSVTITDANGTTYEVPVTNNVASVEDSKLAPPPAAAVLYKLPDGQVHSAELPTPES